MRKYVQKKSIINYPFQSTSVRVSSICTGDTLVESVSYVDAAASGDDVGLDDVHDLCAADGAGVEGQRALGAGGHVRARQEHDVHVGVHTHLAHAALAVTLQLLLQRRNCNGNEKK